MHVRYPQRNPLEQNVNNYSAGYSPYISSNACISSSMSSEVRRRWNDHLMCSTVERFLDAQEGSQDLTLHFAHVGLRVLSPASAPTLSARRCRAEVQSRNLHPVRQFRANRVFIARLSSDQMDAARRN